MLEPSAAAKAVYAYSHRKAKVKFSVVDNFLEGFCASLEIHVSLASPLLEVIGSTSFQS